MFSKKSKKNYVQKEDNITKNSQQIYLIIVESPSKCKKIEGFLGEKYKCISTIGHLREIQGLKSIDTKNKYNIKFSISESKKKHVEMMRHIITQFSNEHVLLATDDDREGEAIAWHICDIFGLDVEKTRRIIFHEITEEALLRSVSSTTTINMKLVRAQWARQVLDMLIGFKISPMLWKYMYYDKDNSLSAGRCQTPALRLVYDNELEKRNGTGMEKSYKILGYFTERNIEFVLTKEFEIEEDVIDFMTKSKDFQHVISLGSPKELIVSPPKPFNTSQLLQTASNILHISPKDTMKYCQVLYQNGYITYMRTENQRYSSEYIKDVKEYIGKTWCEKHIGDTSKLENNDKTKPHEAIRVTHINVNELSGKEYVGKIGSLYALIWRNSIQSCMAEAKYQTIAAHISTPYENVVYNHTIEIPIFTGWSAIQRMTTVYEDNLCDSSPLEKKQSIGTGTKLYLQTLIHNNPVIPFQKIETQMTFHNRHSHYTESGLIKKLETLGIGRPSTFAIFIETIMERGYVKKTDIEGITVSCKEFVLVSDRNITHKNKDRVVGNEKSKLVIQPTGVLVIEFLMKYFNSIFDYDYTKKLEENLDIISENECGEQWHKLCVDCDHLLKRCIQPMNVISKTTYNIDENHQLLFSKYGPTIQIKKESPDDLPTFIPVKKNIVLDLDKLKRNEYTLEELEETPIRNLGTWENETVYIKNGQYGAYLVWGDKKMSCKGYDKSHADITIDDVKTIIEQETKQHMNILRVLNSEMSVRRGKFGAYIYYKTLAMKKPQFLNIKKFKEGFTTCKSETLVEWINNTYLDKK